MIETGGTIKDSVCYGEPIIDESSYPFTLTELLVNTAKKHPDKEIIFLNKEGYKKQISYSILLAEARKYLTCLNESGLKQGDKLVLQLDDNYKFIIIFWACVLGGIIPVILNVPDNFKVLNSDNKTLLNVLGVMDRAIVLTNNQLIESISSFLETQHNKNKILNIDSLVGKEPKKEIETKPDDISVILFTSGSTGAPKGITLTHGNIVNLEKAVVQMNDFNSNDISVNWMPLEHVGGIVMFHIRDVYCGAKQIIIRKEYILAKPIRWIDVISNYKATITWAPNFAFSLINQSLEQSSTIDGWDLSNMKFILNGGEAINPTTSRRFLELLAQFGLSDNSIFPSWGMSETSSGMVYSHCFNSSTGVNCLDSFNYGELVKLSDSNCSGSQFVQLGHPIPGSAIRIVNSAGKVIKENLIGNIQVKGKNVTCGYYNNDALNKQVFTKDNWFDTGDIGFVSDGKLTITGRIKDIIVINGNNYNSSDIEYVIETIEAVVPTFTAAISVRDSNSDTDKLVIFYCSEKKDITSIYNQIIQIEKKLIENFRLRASEIIPLQKKDIGKTSIGKIKRTELVRKYLEGKYKEIIDQTLRYATDMDTNFQNKSLPLTRIQAELLLISKTILGITNLGINDSFFNTGGNSIHVIMLVAEINRVFEVDVPVSTVFELQKLNLIADFIKESKKINIFPIIRAEIKKCYPVTSSQKRMLLINEMEGIGCTYNNPLLIKLKGELNIVRLEQAFQVLLQRHDILRTSFHFQNETYLQEIHEFVPFYLKYIRLDETENLDKHDILKKFVKPFKLDKAPLMRGIVIQTNENDFLLGIDVHHVITDGTSQMLMMNEVFQIYEGRNNNFNQMLQFKDYAVWEDDYFKSETIRQKEQFWMNMDLTANPKYDLNLDFQRKVIQSFEGKVISEKISGDLKIKLQKIANENGTTIFTILFMTYKLLLAKYSGSEELVVGTLVNGRTRSEIRSMLGLFTNSLPIKSHPSKSKKISEYLIELKDILIRALSNHEYPFDKMVEKLSHIHNTNRNPMFDTMFIYQNYDQSIKLSEDSSLKIVSFENVIVGSKVDITLYGVEKSGQIEFILEYCSSLFKESTMQRFMYHYLQILQLIVEGRVKYINELYLTDENISNLLFHKPIREIYPETKVIQQLFKERVEISPDSSAVNFGDLSFTYSKLNNLSNEVANLLKRMNIGRNQIVAILLDRSPDMIVAMLGVIKSGAAFLPIDPELPTDRVRYMLEDSEAKAIITTSELYSDIIPDQRISILDMVTLEYKNSLKEPINTNVVDDPVYVYYTSGSSGKPKGVVVSHKAVNNFIHSFNKKIGMNEKDTILSITTISFDPVIVETFLSLVFGISIVLTNHIEQKDVNAIAKLIDNNEISVLQITPSRLKLFLKNENNIESLKKLKKLIIGGEALSKSLYQSISFLNQTDIYNVYGPTEATVWTTVKHITQVSDISIGNPIGNMEIYILDENFHMQPTGIPGEIYISGDGLAKGYLNNEKLTKDKFVDNPFRKGKKMYASGDQGRWLENGEVDYLGRIDSQVKIRGYRIELDEISNQLLQSNLVEEVVTIILGNTEDEGDEASICLYFVSDKNINITEINEYLYSKLPSYMIPRFYVQVSSIPLTPSGKTDIKKLPKPSMSERKVLNYLGPKTIFQKFLVEMWEEILGIEPIGIRDNFFELGGNSFKATLFIYRLQEKTGKVVSLRTLYEYPTIELIDEKVDHNLLIKAGLILPTVARDYYPLSHQQSMIYAATQINGGDLAYNLPVYFEVRGSINVTKMKDSIIEVLNRHSVFKTYLEWHDEEIVQKINYDVKFKVEILNQDGLSQEEALESFMQPFDLHTAPLVRVRILLLSEKTIIMFDIHHIITDGVSLKIFFDEISRLYEGQELSEVNLHYTDYLSWSSIHSEYSQDDENYWITQFEKPVSQIDIRTDFKRPLIRNLKGGNTSIQLNKEWLINLNQSLSNNNQTLFTGLISALYLILYTYSDSNDIIIGTPVSSRPQVEFSSVLGMFINTIALRQDIESEITLMQFLSDVNSNLVDAFTHKSYPFSQLLKKLNYKSSPGRTPIFDVMIVLQNFEFEGIHIEGTDVNYFQPKMHLAKFDLVLTVKQNDSGLHLNLDYSLSLWKQETIKKILEDYCEALKMIFVNQNMKISDFRTKSKYLEFISDNNNINFIF
ncbi:non-ribosomal peptide synthetase [Paenibacillus beijingensis]|uniref:Carrier domain-containing protein n=1 Tax=Paenibacillus beijingensis TaxID=1126833 RepID=A0A0D5NM97_9BACL|nr:non-ribosomal peptide synthetase [Paenibacillus beijingensis]AJY76270.1 hypothetical protein VN24_19025 [Paenibacillus beijingensis]